MQFLLDIARELREKAARGLILPSDAFVAGIQRNGVRACLFKWTHFLYEAPDLWADDVPEADSDGVPTSRRQRNVLRLLVDKPLKVDAIAAKLKKARARLYDEGHSLLQLVQLELVELTEDGYVLTAKGRRTASLLEPDLESD